jgi:predicted Zn-dependent peptidase
VRRATEQAQLALGVRTCSRHDPRRFALRLLNTLVAENMSSRLFQVIREDRGLAYNIYSSLSYFDDTGDLVISAGLDPGKLNQTLGLILTEMGRLRREVVGRAEFQRARDYVLGQFDLGLENTESRMMWLGEQVLTYGDVMDPTAVKRKLAAVTAAAVRNAARDFFRPERLNLALVSPLRSAEPLRRRLEGRAHGLSDS